jgi:hypothetical protein
MTDDTDRNPISIDIDEFRYSGMAIARGVISQQTIGFAEEALLQLYLMQARKITEHREDVRRLEDLDEPPSAREALTFILDRLEAADKGPLYQVQKMLPQNWSVRNLFGPRFLSEIMPLVFDGVADYKWMDVDAMLVEGPGLFVNRPREQRLLYKWHSEAHYYPKRRNFINVWLPIFGPRSSSNGAMSLLPGSHTKNWDFAEYQGYNHDTLGKQHHFVQYEIPESELKGFLDNEVVVDVAPGDAVFFHRNLVHRSNLNTSGEYAFAIVARVWTPAEDLTLAGNMAVTPYGGDNGGRPGLFGAGVE